jgi:hypothetical protein
VSKYIVLALLALAACTPKETTSSTQDAAVATPSASVAASASASAAPAANADNDPLPSHSDVAKQVRTEITKDNYKAKLDEIEKSPD